MKTMKDWRSIEKEVTGLKMAKFKPVVSKIKRDTFICHIDFIRKNQRSWEGDLVVWFTCQDYTQALLRNIESISK